MRLYTHISCHTHAHAHCRPPSPPLFAFQYGCFRSRKSSSSRKLPGPKLLAVCFSLNCVSRPFHTVLSCCTIIILYVHTVLCHSSLLYLLYSTLLSSTLPCYTTLCYPSLLSFYFPLHYGTLLYCTRTHARTHARTHERTRARARTHTQRRLAESPLND